MLLRGLGAVVALVAAFVCATSLSWSQAIIPEQAGSFIVPASPSPGGFLQLQAASPNALLCTNGSLDVTTASCPSPAAGLPSMTPTACPTAMLGIAATPPAAPVLEYQVGCFITSLVGSGNLTGGGSGPTPPAITLVVPSPTACPSQMLGEDSSNRVWLQTGGCAAIVGQSKTAFTIVLAFPAATASPGLYTQPIPISGDYVQPTLDAGSLYCTNAGYGASQTIVHVYEATPAANATPILSTANPVFTSIPLATGTSQAVYATAAPTAFPTNATSGAPTYFFATYTSVSGTPVSGTCTLTLNGLQRIIQ